MPSPKLSDEVPRLMIRFPSDVKVWLKQQATHNASSQASEVVRAVRERMERQGRSLPVATMEG